MVITTAFQAEDESSILSSRSKLARTRWRGPGLQNQLKGSIPYS